MTNSIKDSLQKLETLAKQNNHNFRVEEHGDYKLAIYFINHDYRINAGDGYVNRNGRGKYIRSQKVQDIIEKAMSELKFLRKEGFFTAASENY